MRRTRVLVLAPLVLYLFHSASGVANGGFTISTIATFNGTNGSSPTAGLTVDAQGNLYGTTQKGGANGDGTVFEIAAGTHALSTIATFNGTNGAFPYAGVTLDAQGNLYGTTFNGGANGEGTVFKIAAGTTTLSTVASLNGTNGVGSYAGVTLDAQGNIYGTTVGGGANDLGTVFELVNNAAVVPEPASLLALGQAALLGIALAARADRRRAQAR